jgi:hypothetical protein
MRRSWGQFRERQREFAGRSAPAIRITRPDEDSVADLQQPVRRLAPESFVRPGNHDNGHFQVSPVTWCLAFWPAIAKPSSKNNSKNNR